MRYSDPKHFEKGIDPQYDNFRNLYGTRDSELVYLAKFAQSKDGFPIMDQVQTDIRINDPEAKFIERLMEISTTKPNFAAVGGRKTIYAEYYKKLNALMKDPYLQ